MARTRRLRITKVPQCRHSEKQGFVSYTEQTIAGNVYYTAHCSNCGSASADAYLGKEFARNDLMRIEAPPLVP